MASSSVANVPEIPAESAHDYDSSEEPEEQATVEDRKPVPNILDISAASVDDATAISFLQSLGTIPAHRTCDECNVQMVMKPKHFRNNCCVQAQSRTAQSGSQYEWRCSGSHKSKGTKRTSVFYNTIFQNAKISPRTLLHLLFKFACDCPAYIAVRELDRLINYPSVLEWYDKFRQVCKSSIENDPVTFDADEVDIGRCEVEIDESWFGKKRKNNKGTGKQTTCVFGIVQRNGRKCLFKHVKTNSKEQLLPIIQKHIAQTCTVFSDGLATYLCLPELGYGHRVVNHSKELVTKEGIHTNTVEGVWGLCKQRVSQMHGLKNEEALVRHLAEFSYRQRFKDGRGCIWNRLIYDIAHFSA